MKKDVTDPSVSKTRRDPGSARNTGSERAEMHDSRSSRPPGFKGRVSREALVPSITLVSAGVMLFSQKLFNMSHILEQSHSYFALGKQ